MNFNKKKMARINYNSANEKDYEIPLKFEIKDEPTDDDSLNQTECDDNTVETLSKGTGSEIACEDSKVYISYNTKLVENMDYTEDSKNFISANKINQEIRLKFEIKSEPTNYDSLNLTECADNTVEILSKGNSSEIACDDSKVYISYYTKLVENMDYTEDSKNVISASKFNQEIPLKFEIKEEPMNDNSLNLTRCADAVDILFESDGSETRCENSKINNGQISGNNVAKCLNKRKERKKNMSVKNERHKKATEKAYHCDICYKCFTRSFTWKIHMRIHSGEKPYQCDVCNRCFSKSSNLKIHKRTHTGNKPYQCDVCNKYFRHSSTLNIHKTTHTTEKPYQCEVCKKCFRHSDGLKLHKRTHTGEKPYQCDVCKKCFSVSSNLNSHKRTHTGEKPYQCDVCNKCYSVSSHLINHKRIHTGEKPYQCDVCNKCFSRANNLSRHKRTHTN